MKKIILITTFVMAMFAVGAQSIVTYQPGRTIMQYDFDVTAIGGSDTSFKFALPQGASVYTIYVACTDTIEPNDTIYSRLYGSMDGGKWFAVSDTIQIDSTNYPCEDYWTGTSFPWPFGKVEVDAPTTATDGNINLIIYYREQ